MRCKFDFLLFYQQADEEEEKKAALQAAEEQRRKKAALLAKMKELEGEDDGSSPLVTSPLSVLNKPAPAVPAVIPPIAKKQAITNDDLDSILGISTTKATVNPPSTVKDDVSGLVL